MPQEKKPMVSVVITVYNNTDLSQICLDSLLKQDYPNYEIIVVDDGSTDNTVEIISRYPVKLIENQHLGISAARNRGIRAASGNIIVAIDSDVKVPEDLITRMVPALQDEKVGIAMAWWDIANSDNLVASLSFRAYEYFVRNLQELDFLWAYCFAARKSLFSEVGLFNESIYVGEDVDLAHRVTGAGYKIKLMKDVRVWHHFRDSLGRHLKRHFQTARTKFIYVLNTRKFTDQRGNWDEYIKLVLHILTVLSLFLIPWWPEVFLVCLSMALLSHLRMTIWGMKKGLKYGLLLPFKFLTYIIWALGVMQGIFWIVRGYKPSPKNL